MDVGQWDPYELPAKFAVSREDSLDAVCITAAADTECISFIGLIARMTHHTKVLRGHGYSDYCNALHFVSTKKDSTPACQFLFFVIFLLRIYLLISFIKALTFLSCF